MKRIIYYLLAFIFFPGFMSFSYAFQNPQHNAGNPDLKEILNKKKIKIVVTDSGLGGMSVCAGVEEKLKEVKSFEEVELIFFNALPEKGSGYNSLPSTERKAEVFNEALLSMEEKYSPDIILIACNTLSVVYPYTKFSVESKTPVLGIVDFGVEMIINEAIKNEKSEVILFGTQTTIKSESHKNKLIESGINEKRIVSQACPGLETEIQNAPGAESTTGMLELYVYEATGNLTSEDSPVYAALCCTHYGFALDAFQKSLNESANREVKVLNPNSAMINAMVLDDNTDKYNDMKIKVSVVSRAVISENEIESIGNIIKPYAPLSSTALSKYEYNPDLFKFLKE
jgi:glutamate racemase